MTAATALLALLALLVGYAVGVIAERDRRRQQATTIAPRRRSIK